MTPDILLKTKQFCNRLAERNPAPILQVQDTIKEYRRASNAPTTHYPGTRPEQEIQANPDQRGAPPSRDVVLGRPSTSAICSQNTTLLGDAFL